MSGDRWALAEIRALLISSLHIVLSKISVLFLPRLGDVLRFACAVDQSDVSRAGLGGAHSHEVRPRAADGELGEVGQRLADGRPKQEGAHDLVERGHVLVEV